MSVDRRIDSGSDLGSRGIPIHLLPSNHAPLAVNQPTKGESYLSAGRPVVSASKRNSFKAAILSLSSTDLICKGKLALCLRANGPPVAAAELVDASAQLCIYATRKSALAEPIKRALFWAIEPAHCLISFVSCQTMAVQP
jgi:hypothetical protein